MSWSYFRDQLHVTVLNAVVDHLDVVSSTLWFNYKCVFELNGV